jgi:hypothetical protein
VNQASQTRVLCLLLVLHCVVSFRSVPRILEAVSKEAGSSFGSWIPHFTSVINWTLRLGLGLLRQVTPVDVPWLAIIDHSIDIGTKKALVVLRVPMDALARRKSAITLEDCECIGLTVREQVNGDYIAADLTDIFKRSGNPSGIIKDNDPTLQKGVMLWMKTQSTLITIIADISHVMAAALKQQFEKDLTFQDFIKLTNHAAQRLRQTSLAFLKPPKLRGKGRFLSISTLGKWAAKMLAMMTRQGCAAKEDMLGKLHEALPGFLSFQSFISTFIKTTQIVTHVMEILKNKGLTKESDEQCRQLCMALPAKSEVRQRLYQWLQVHRDIQQQFRNFPLIVSSDIIESLFGNYKHITSRNPQPDMNRSALLIPALCGKSNKTTIHNALNDVSHLDLIRWEQENIPYTMRKKRHEFFDKNIQNTG